MDRDDDDDDDNDDDLRIPKKSSPSYGPVG